MDRKTHDWALEEAKKAPFGGPSISMAEFRAKHGMRPYNRERAERISAEIAEETARLSNS